MIDSTRRQRISGLVILLILVLFSTVSNVTNAQSPLKTTKASQEPMSKMLASVVRITTRDQSLAVLNESLGLIISKEGLIITNSLAIKDAYIATASVSGGSTYFIESVVAKDVILDLALLRIRGQHFPAVELSDGIGPKASSELFALKSWEENNTELLIGKASTAWQTANKIDMIDFPVVLGGKVIGGPVVDKEGKLVGISNTVSRPFQRGSIEATTICPIKIISTFASKNASEKGALLASAYSGAFGPDGAGKLVKIWKLLENKKYDDAQRILRVMPSLLQETFVYSLTLGLTQLNLKKYEAAAKSFSIASSRNPFDANPPYQGGLALRGAKKFEDSILALQEATQRNPNHIKAFIAMGRSYNAMNQPSLAIDVLSKALAIDGNNVDAHLNIGISYWGMSNREQTVNHLMQASMIAPKSSAGMRASALMDSGLPMPNEQ